MLMGLLSENNTLSSQISASALWLDYVEPAHWMVLQSLRNCREFIKNSHISIKCTAIPGVVTQAFLHRSGTLKEN